MSVNKCFRFDKTTTNDNNALVIKKFEITLKVNAVTSNNSSTPPANKTTTTYGSNVATTINPSKPAASGKPATQQTKTILTYSFTTSYPNAINQNVEFDSGGTLTISFDLEDKFYPISSIFWGKDYNNFKCDGSQNLFRISDSSKLPFVIKNNSLKISLPISLYATEMGVSSLQQAINLNCPSQNFVFGKIVVLYTEETVDTEKLVSVQGEREYFTNDNKYVGIC